MNLNPLVSLLLCLETESL